MVKDFYKDLEKAHTAENIVLEVFSSLSSEYNFENVSNDRNYFYKGDILATSEAGRKIGIEVKDDSRIADTRNILCEEKVWYVEGGYYGKGNMQSEYDIYCVVSQAENKIYVIDFKRLQKYYKYGTYKEIPHADQTTCCYLCSLEEVKKWRALLAVVDYGGEKPTFELHNLEAQQFEAQMRYSEALAELSEYLKNAR